MSNGEFYKLLALITAAPLTVVVIEAVQLWKRRRRGKTGGSMGETSWSMGEFDRFEKKAKAQGLSKKQQPLLWFFVTYVRDGGSFAGAILVQAENMYRALDASPKQPLLEGEGASFDETVEVPDNKLPPEEYRNRVLTLEEVRSFWPWVKA